MQRQSLRKPWTADAARTVHDSTSDLQCCSGERASIVVGVTSHETCHALKGRLKALREAGFRVTLVCRHGALFDRIAADEKVESIAISMNREIAPISDVISLFRIWRVLRRAAAGPGGVWDAKGRFAGHDRRAALRGAPTHLYVARAQA